MRRNTPGVIWVFVLIALITGGSLFVAASIRMPSPTAAPMGTAQERAQVSEELSPQAEVVPQASYEPKTKPPSLPRLAIIVDDFGYSLAQARRLAEFPLPLTWAILPFLGGSEEAAKIAKDHGIPYLLHLPMQAEGDGNSGPYVIGVNMSDQEIRSATRGAINSLPGAIGVNNHRGSLATSDKRVMRALLAEVQLHGLPFVDSRTTSHSVVPSVAKELGMPVLANDIFLDHEEDEKAIAMRLETASSIARRRGYAVAICHVRKDTIAFLSKATADMFKGVELVTVPQLFGELEDEDREEGK